MEEVINEIQKRIEEVKLTGIEEKDFETTKRKIYGEFVKDYNDVSSIATGFVGCYFRNIHPFDYFEEFDSITKEYVEKTLKDMFNKKNQVVSIIKPNKEQ